PEEDIGPFNYVAELARRGGPRIARLDRVHPFASTLIHDAFRVGDQDVLQLQAETHQLIKTGNSGGTGARTCQLDLADIFTHQRKTVENRRRGDDRSAVLVVMEDGNFHALPQRALYVEALWRLDILEIDTAEGRLQAGDDVHDLVWITLVDLNPHSPDNALSFGAACAIQI